MALLTTPWPRYQALCRDGILVTAVIAPRPAWGCVTNAFRPVRDVDNNGLFSIAWGTIAVAIVGGFVAFETAPNSGRRRLLVLTGAASTVSACGGDSGASPAADAGANRLDVVTMVPTDRDQPYLGLDGYVTNPVRSGWSAAVGGIDVGAVDDFAMGVWHLNAGARAIVSRDARGFFAFSALCTHEACVVDPPDATGTSACMCHGSRFDGAGRVTMRPARTDLPPFEVIVSEGRVYVNPAREVPRDQRTAVPVDAGVVDGGAGDASLVDRPALDVPPADTGPRDTGVDVNPCTRGTDVGAVGDFVTGRWVVRTPANEFGATERVAVARDAMGIYAYSLVCTHSGCDLNPSMTNGEAICPCHASRFDGLGAVLTGPARMPLVHFMVRVCAGRVRVDIEQTVASSTRAMVT